MAVNHIKWGILGSSYISEVMAKAINESTASELTAIGSRSLATANEFASQFSIRKVYGDYQTLLNDAEIDAVYIGLPNHLHKEWIIRSAQAGKHILCEKPFVISADEAIEASAAVKAANVFCMEALMYLRHPFIKKLKEIVESKILGDIKLYNATYTANIADKANPTAGGSIRNLGCYPISLIRLLANAEPIGILATGRFNENTNTDNLASAILTFADDSIAVVSTADDIKMSWQFDIHGTNGSMKVTTNPWLPDRDNNHCILIINDEEVHREINVTAENSLYTYQIDAVNQHIHQQNYRHVVDELLHDSLGNVTVLEAWLDQVKRKHIANTSHHNCLNLT